MSIFDGFWAQLSLRTTVAAAVASVALLLAPPADAYNATAKGRVVAIEAHAGARFTLNKAVGSCAANTWLTMDSSVANADKVETAKKLLLSALLSEREVSVYIINSGCKVEFLHLH